MSVANASIGPNVPQHVGYIVDGNRRWAKSYGLPPYEGHLAGYNAIQDVAKATFDAGVKYVSAYIFSTENWKRSEDEVKKLMSLVLRLLTADLPKFSENNIRLRVLGSKDNVPQKILDAIDNAEAVTADNDAGTLALCFNYGGQQEIVDAIKKCVQDGEDIANLTPASFAKYLYYPEVPALDLLVRTSGEQRISNFMLWRSAYAELIFVDKNWPAMTADDVSLVIEQYQQRKRRFGA